MKLNTATSTTTSTFTGAETQQFSIEMNAKAFRTLLDGLYSDKITAVIRELWSNALDSHIAAGMESIPFDCHLPSALDPTFRVRDYGTSLTHDEVMNLYTTIFRSTKEDSNEFVGALGLGSKSPFAYSDTFTVIARLNGEKRTYFASMANGTPEISLVSTVASDEAQGLEISIAVDHQDFAEFARDARVLAAGFDPLPSVDGIEIEPCEPFYVADDNSFALFAPRVLPSESVLSVRQGCVIYPVSDYSITANLSNVLNHGYKMVLDVPIGSVSIVASREALSLDEPTRTFLNAAVKTATTKLKQEIETRSNACKNRLEALEFWYGDNRADHEAFRVQATYKGEYLRPIVNLEGHKSDREDLRPLARMGNQRGAGERIRQLSFNSRKHLKFVLHYTDRQVPRAMIRYRQAVTDNGSNYTYLLVDPTSRQLERLIRVAGLKPSQFVWVGSLTDPGPPARAPRGTGTVGVAGVNRMNDRQGYRWTKADQLPTGDFLWFEVERAGRQNHRYQLGNYIQAVQHGMAEKSVYGFTPTAVKRHKPDPAKNVDKAAKAYRDAGRAAYVDRVCKSVYAQHTPSSLLKALGDKSYGYESREAFFGYEAYDEGAEKGMEMVKALKAKYPLLFDDGDSEAVKAYIAQCDAAAANKP